MPPPVDVTTVADDLVVCHDGATVHCVDGLAPDREYTVLGQAVRTLPRPPGDLLFRFATVNDVHFGETECGRIDDLAEGPIRRAGPGEPPYPETMNRAAVAEMRAAGIDTVIVKGDLSADGHPNEWDAFEACYRDAFGDRLHVVRGNHDAYRGQQRYAGDQEIRLPGLTVALLDTVIPERSTGQFTPGQAEWLADLAADADGPVMVMGHHQNWAPGGRRSDDYFGIHPDGSERLVDVIARRRRIIAYTAGHTHRHRVRRVEATGPVPYVEVGCVKDFPGTWAEYRVHEGGVLQVVHRISSPEALAWSEQCRTLYSDFGIDYASYALGGLDDRCFVIPTDRVG
jgi:3',5'-cyclic AMP phosphodiesterase CpdA